MRGRFNDYKRTDAKSKYSNVYEFKNKISGDLLYIANVRYNGEEVKNRFDTEREAALAVDKFLIRQGEEPVNILKRVKSN